LFVDASGADYRAGSSTPITRTVFCAMVGSALISATAMVGSLAVPSQAPAAMAWQNVGTTATCDMQGFLNVWGAHVLCCWDLVLTILYVLLISYRWPNSKLRQLERIAHAFIWIYSLVICVAALVNGSYNNGYDYCWLNALPYDCGYEGYPDCERGSNYRYFVVELYGLFGVTLVVAVGSMVTIYRAVLHLEQKNQQYSFTPTPHSSFSSQPSSRRTLREEASTIHRKSRQTAIQGLVYVSTMVCSNLPMIVTTVLYEFWSIWNDAVGQTAFLLSTIHPIFYMYAFFRNRSTLRTRYGCLVRWVLFDSLASCLSSLRRRRDQPRMEDLDHNGGCHADPSEAAQGSMTMDDLKQKKDTESNDIHLSSTTRMWVSAETLEGACLSTESQA